MTYIEPTPPGTPQPDITPPRTPGPDIDPAGAPDEIPPIEPGGGDEGDSRPYGHKVPGP
ncbi:hypothetical protein GCM10009116_12180 [Brevundimonas basaltis]|uniref:Uncharacterized protein n=1 Tax=Brevundimonas basaltis TaxID=472166 RepID=A0A7W8MFJ0_9CAUL|nr:hypothetical protein [Brevundimonas basaltis]MBB5290654.1 hypothetical protein [Brevundimonas basaltis]